MIQALMLSVLVAAAGSALSSGDRAFITQALASGQLEIQHAQAELRANDAHVRAFAQQLIRDHTAMNAQLSTVANERGVPVGNATMSSPAPPASAQSARAYAQAEVRDHQKAIALFEREASRGQDAQMRKIASAALPILRKHLAMAEALLRR